VTRIDVRTLRTRSYPVGPSPYDVTFAGRAAGRLWIADFAGTDVIVVNPARLPATS